MQPNNLAHDADEDRVTRSLEAYLLWLFGYIMFNNSQLGFSGTCSHVPWNLQGIGAK